MIRDSLWRPVRNAGDRVHRSSPYLTQSCGGDYTRDNTIFVTKAPNSNAEKGLDHKSDHK